MRFVAAFGIVWAHMQAPFSAEGYVALALFLILIGFLSVRSLARGGIRRFWLGRLIRFFLPWLVWSALFGGLLILRGGWANAVPVDPFRLLIGPSIHLWFLPFVVLTSPLVIVMQQRVNSVGQVWLVALGTVPAAVLAIRAHDSSGLPEPIAQWAFATMPLFYGLLSAVAHHRQATVAPMVFATLTCGIAYVGFDSPIAPFLFLAAVGFETLWRITVQMPRLARLGELSFGIYLVHPVFILVWYHFAGSDRPAAFGAIAVFIASAMCTAILRLVPMGRVIT